MKNIKTGGGVLSHPVGLAVHDNGTYKRRTKVGHVFAVDLRCGSPMKIYIFATKILL